jgi:hypothetical protein
MSSASAIVDYQLIGNWLGLPAGPWPPDHYTLLGLQPGETDCARIEQSVHERLMRVRHYQLTHPAQATEAMTRLAKAFDCLTTPAAKKAYDQAHFPQLAAPPAMSARTLTTVSSDTGPLTPIKAEPWWSETPLHWQPAVAPPPIRLPDDTPPLPPPVRPPPVPLDEPSAPPPVRAPKGESAEQPQATMIAPPAVAEVPRAVLPALGENSSVLPPLAMPRLPFDPLLESIRDSGAVRRGIELRRGLYERIRWLRRLQRAWERVGRYLHKPKRRLSKLAEETDLSRLLLNIEDLLHEAPAVLGEPGQPGYRVLALAKQEPVVERFKAMDEHDRGLLARDWFSGRELLSAYRRFLRQQILAQRHLTGSQRLRRQIDALLTDHLLAVLGALGVLAVIVLVAFYLWG